MDNIFIPWQHSCMVIVLCDNYYFIPLWWHELKSGDITISFWTDFKTKELTLFKLD